jgi:hypothetical protein
MILIHIHLTLILIGDQIILLFYIHCTKPKIAIQSSYVLQKFWIHKLCQDLIIHDNYGANVFSWVVNNWMHQKSNKWHMLVVVKTFIMQDVAKSHIGIFWSKKHLGERYGFLNHEGRQAALGQYQHLNWVLFQPKKKGPTLEALDLGTLKVKEESVWRSAQNGPFEKTLNPGDNFSFDNFIKSLN